MAKSNRTGFYSTFPTLGQTSFDVESWEPFFANFDEEFWSEEGSGVVGFRTEEQLEYSAIVTPASTEGFVIVLACDDLQTNRKRCPKSQWKTRNSWRTSRKLQTRSSIPLVVYSLPKCLECDA